MKELLLSISVFQADQRIHKIKHNRTEREFPGNFFYREIPLKHSENRRLLSQHHGNIVA